MWCSNSGSSIEFCPKNCRRKTGESKQFSLAGEVTKVQYAFAILLASVVLFVFIYFAVIMTNSKTNDNCDSAYVKQQTPRRGGTEYLHTQRDINYADANAWF